MRILLAQNALYYPAHGGGDTSNRLLMEALAARGHECLAVARIPVFGEHEQTRYLAELAARGVGARTEEGAAVFERRGVEIHVVTGGNLRDRFAAQVAGFRPDIILASSDDPAQVLLEVALGAAGARVVYLARATLALPFGPDCAFPSETKTARWRAADRVVGVSQYVADYIRRHGGIEAVHVPISLLEGAEWPALGRFTNEFVTMANPCAVKGIAIFLALADALPQTAFAAVPTWGTNGQDRAALEARPNITLLPAADEIGTLLARTRVLLVPSLWAEARSRIVLEAMLHGVPVIASDVGGIPEAKMGVPYLVPVKQIARYQPRVDEQMVPVAEVPAQDIEPWRSALARLLEDRAHYEEIARQSREAALAYASRLSVEPFEGLLREVIGGPKMVAIARPVASALSDDRRKLLALRLRKKAPASSWFPGVDEAEAPRLFWFPHAGGGAGQANRPPHLVSRLVPVRLPGRESRLAEAPFERMEALPGALADAIENYLDRPFAFFGHSMGAAVAFELARELRRRGRLQPGLLIASAARAPQFRLNHVPPPDPTDDELLADLKRLEGTPVELLQDRVALSAIWAALRADTVLYRHYVYQPEPPLDCAIRAYGGLEDPNVTAEHLEAWAAQTTSSFAVRRFRGGHFYWQTAGADFLTALVEDLE